MTNYRPIYGKQLWSSDRFIELDTNSKVVYLYLLTCPLADTTGIYYIRKKQIEIDTNLTQDDVIESINILQRCKLIAYNDEKKSVYIPNYFKFSKGMIKNPKKLYECMKRQKEIIRIKEFWVNFDDENAEILESIDSVLTDNQPNKNNSKVKNKADNTHKAKSKAISEDDSSISHQRTTHPVFTDYILCNETTNCYVNEKTKHILIGRNDYEIPSSFNVNQIINGDCAFFDKLCVALNLPEGTIEFF